MRKIEITGKLSRVNLLQGNAELTTRTTAILEENLFEDGQRRTVFHGVTVYGDKSRWLRKLEEKGLTVIVCSTRFRSAAWDTEAEKDLHLILEGELIAVV